MKIISSTKLDLSSYVVYRSQIALSFSSFYSCQKTRELNYEMLAASTSRTSLRRSRGRARGRRENVHETEAPYIHLHEYRRFDVPAIFQNPKPFSSLLNTKSFSVIGRAQH